MVEEEVLNARRVALSQRLDAVLKRADLACDLSLRAQNLFADVVQEQAARPVSVIVKVVDGQVQVRTFSRRISIQKLLAAQTEAAQPPQSPPTR